MTSTRKLPAAVQAARYELARVAESQELPLELLELSLAMIAFDDFSVSIRDVNRLMRELVSEGLVRRVGRSFYLFARPVLSDDMLVQLISRIVDDEYGGAAPFPELARNRTLAEKTLLYGSNAEDQLFRLARTTGSRLVFDVRLGEVPVIRLAASPRS